METPITLLSQVKILLPVRYSGKSDPGIWLTQVETYFKLICLQESDKQVLLAMSLLGKNAAAWASFDNRIAQKLMEGTWENSAKQLEGQFTLGNSVTQAKDSLRSLKFIPHSDLKRYLQQMRALKL